VLKSYEQSYAREAFQNMDEEAQQRLWEPLKPEETYDPAGLPSRETLAPPASADSGIA